jgi:hypothetical protein
VAEMSELSEGLQLQGSNDQFNFDGKAQGGGDGNFGAGWEDDLEEMLIKGMKKKAQRRIALLAGFMVAGVLVGGLIAGIFFKLSGSAAPAPPSPSPAPGGPLACEGDPNVPCKSCTPLDGGGFEDWTVTCIDLEGLKCQGCEGNGQLGGCPHDCTCTAWCKHSAGVVPNTAVMGDDGVYSVNCQDGQWTRESCAPSDAVDLSKPECLLCNNVDDCASAPCRNGGCCFDSGRGGGYSCTCPDGYNGTNCEIDIDSCQNGSPGGSCRLAGSGAGASHSVKCVESTDVYTFSGGVMRADASVTRDQAIPQNQHYPQFQPGYTNNVSGQCALTGAPGFLNATSDIQGYVCICATGDGDTFDASLPRMYHDGQCTSMNDPCVMAPCHNGGTCAVASNANGPIGTGYTCTCADGFAGASCDTVVCRPGFTGTHCQTAVITSAVALFKGQHGVWGGVRLESKGSGSSSTTALTVTLQNVHVGLGLWHIHANDGDDSDPCTQAGGHYGAETVWNLPRYAGPMPNGTGTISFTVNDPNLPLDDLLDKAIVIHQADKSNTKYLCAPIEAVPAGANCTSLRNQLSAVDTQHYSYSPATTTDVVLPGQPASASCPHGYDTKRDSFVCGKDGQLSGHGGWVGSGGSPYPGSLDCQDFDACASNHGHGPCRQHPPHNTTCQDLPAPSATARCICTGPWGGGQCQTHLRSSHCRHVSAAGVITNLCHQWPGTHSTCPPGQSGTCACPRGTSGRLCETDVNECLAQPCLNGGICTDSHNNSRSVHIPLSHHRCACTVDYSGDNCGLADTPAGNPCTPTNPCQHRGHCHANSSNVHTCSCVAGVSTGPNCQTDVDACDAEGLDYCGNNAVSCMDHHFAPGAACVCKHGWHGLQCNVRTATPCDHIAGTPSSQRGPCQNGGVCTDVDGAAVCNCTSAPGWFGTHCSSNINYCHPNPCRNNGTCHDLPPAGLGSPIFTCTCTGNWQNAPGSQNEYGSNGAISNGAICAMPRQADPCASNPCGTAHGVQCHAAGTSYTCSGKCTGHMVCSSQDCRGPCVAIGVGRKANAAHTVSVACDPDTAWPLTAANGQSCTRCALGEEPAANATACRICDPGQAADPHHPGRCVNCPHGKQPSGRQRGVSASLYGRNLGANVNSTKPLRCVPCHEVDPSRTRYSAHGGTCQQCALGRSPNTAESGCTSCPCASTAGATCKIAPQRGLCQPCPAGTKPDHPTPGRGRHCIVCSQDHYSDSGGRTCFPCPAGRNRTHPDKHTNTLAQNIRNHATLNACHNASS